MSFQPEVYTEEYFTYIFLWHSMGDACHKCLALNEQEWRNQDLFDEILYDIFWGDVYNLNLGMSLTHPNCRCSLEVRTEVHLEEVDELQEFNRFLRILV